MYELRISHIDQISEWNTLGVYVLFHSYGFHALHYTNLRTISSLIIFDGQYKFLEYSGRVIISDEIYY